MILFVMHVVKRFKFIKQNEHSGVDCERRLTEAAINGCIFHCGAVLNLTGF